MGNTSDYLDFCGTWIDKYEDEFCNYGFGALFTLAMNENEEGFDVSFCCGEYDEETAVIYTNRLPWQMSERVRSMTIDDMDAVFAKYIGELGVKAEADYLSVER